MTFNTGNPIGSTDPRDLSDNSENLDRGTNGTAATFTDRLGNTRQSWKGMETEFDADQSARSSEFDTAQADRTTQFQASQDDRDGEFNAYLVSAGYQFAGDYAAGIEITQYNQVVRDTGGEFWRASGSTTLPYTTTGAGLPESGAFVAVGDATLRNELAQSISTGNGAALVNGATIYVGSVAELEALSLSAGANVYLTEEGRAGEFVVKTGTPPSDPQKGINIVLANGNYAERLFSGSVNAQWFGATGDGLTDDRRSIQGAIDYLSDQGGGTLIAPAGTYVLDSKTHLTGVTVNDNSLIHTRPNVSIVGSGRDTVFKVGTSIDDKFYVMHNYSDAMGSLSFKDFVIEVDGENHLPLAGTGSDQWCISLRTAKNVLIDGVRVFNATSRQCFSIGGNDNPPSVDSVLVRNCEIKDVGKSVPGNMQNDHSSFYIIAKKGAIVNNVLTNTEVAPEVVRIATAIETHSSKIIVSGNIINNYHVGVICAALIGDTKDVSVQGNTINTEVALRLYSGSGFNLENIKFDSNICRQSKYRDQAIIDLQSTVGIPVTGPVSITNNEVLGSGITDSKTGGQAVLIGDIDTQIVRGNTFKNIVTNAIRHNSGTTGYSSGNLIIEDNAFINCCTTTNTSYKTVIVLFAAAFRIESVSLKNNFMLSESSSFASRPLEGNTKIGNLDVQGNIFKGAGFTSDMRYTASQLEAVTLDHRSNVDAPPEMPASFPAKWVNVPGKQDYYRRGSAIQALWVKEIIAVSIPSTGTNNQGDRAINVLPDEGEPIGWACVTGGTPGIWKAYGYVDV